MVRHGGGIGGGVNQSSLDRSIVNPAVLTHLGPPTDHDRADGVQLKEGTPHHHARGRGEDGGRSPSGYGGGAGGCPAGGHGSGPTGAAVGAGRQGKFARERKKVPFGTFPSPHQLGGF